MASEKILTLHPDPDKQGVRIDRAKYDLVAQGILDTLKEQGETSFAGLVQAVEARLHGQLEGSLAWYVTTVKLDLEARGAIVRLPGTRPQRLRLGELA